MAAGGFGPRRSPVGVYVHVPFCRMLCTYCDFVKYRGMEAWFDRYEQAVLQEGASWAGRMPDGPARSLFFGGGTPTVLGAERLRRLREALTYRFAVDADAETCVEANPEDVTADLASGLAAAGFGRVSVGIQTFDDALLRRLGRLHTGSQAAEAVQWLHDAGIPSISADLMFGLPGQSLLAWRASLERALDLGLAHLSCYGLTVEPATPLGRRVATRRLRLPDDDAAADMYEHACARLADAGYQHYEVSNWALPGHQSRHNKLYWRGADYVGLGTGAVGCVGGRRWWNERRVEAYCAAVAVGDAIAETEILTQRERARELVLLALRTAEGLDLDRFRQEIGSPFPVAAIQEALDRALLVQQANRLRVPERRWLVLHSILAMVLPEVEAMLPAIA